MATINFNNALGIHDDAMRLRIQRSELLANNLANAETPNYKARDIDFHGLMQQQVAVQNSSLEMKATHGGHKIGAGLAVENQQISYRTPLQPSIDGNTVEEQAEHAAFMENSLGFQATFQLLNGRFKGLMSAIRGE